MQTPEYKSAEQKTKFQFFLSALLYSIYLCCLKRICFKKWHVICIFDITYVYEHFGNNISKDQNILFLWYYIWYSLSENRFCSNDEPNLHITKMFWRWHHFDSQFGYNIVVADLVAGLTRPRSCWRQILISCRWVVSRLSVKQSMALAVHICNKPGHLVTSLLRWGNTISYSAFPHTFRHAFYLVVLVHRGAFVTYLGSIAIARRHMAILIIGILKATTVTKYFIC